MAVADEALQVPVELVVGGEVDLVTDVAGIPQRTGAQNLSLLNDWED